MGELKELFKELLVMLERYGSESYNPQKRLLKEILYIIDENNIDSFSQIRSIYKSLFSPKYGLSEFNIWKDDFTERKRLNDKLENIEQRLWEILEY